MIKKVRDRSRYDKKKDFSNEKELMEKKYRFRVSIEDVEKKLRLRGRLLSKQQSHQPISIDVDPPDDYYDDFLDKIRDRMGNKVKIPYWMDKFEAQKKWL